MTKKFVPATDEVWRLQRGSDPECVFFQTMADKGHYGGMEGASRQGIYVCAPSGKLLASINSNDPNRILQAMKKGLDGWTALPAEERLLAKDAQIKPKHRWEESYPEDGLVLTMYTRDLPDSGKPEEQRAPKWNQDPVWFSKQESRSWLPASLAIGSKQELPEDLMMRLVRLHMVDMVKGQASTYSTRDVKDAKILTEIVELTDTVAKVKINGHTHARSEQQARRTSPHGVITRMVGSATYDLKNHSFVAFELVAIGKRWGHTRFNGRHRDPQEGRIGFVFRLADSTKPRIAPAFIHQYKSDWVKRPQIKIK